MVHAASSSIRSERKGSRAWLRVCLCATATACAPAASPAPAPAVPPGPTTPAAPISSVPPSVSTAPVVAKPVAPLLTQLGSHAPITLPFDVDVAKVALLLKNNDVPGAQRLFDELSWQAFLALNWPAKDNGEPDPAKTLDDATSVRTWLFWRPADTIFLPQGARPAEWKAEKASMDLFRGKAAWRQHNNEPPNPNANETFQAFSGPLVDQNGKWVRYQVLVNGEEFTYIMKNELYSLDGQAKFSQTTTDKSDGTLAFPSNDPAKGTHGAIEIKLAWKELSPLEIASKRFFATDVNVKRVKSKAELEKLKKTEVIETVKAGLVGMHIAMHTLSSPEWIWATFEQVDNVRPHAAENKAQVGPSFANPKLGGCPDGKPNNAVVNVLAKHNGYLGGTDTVPVERAGNSANTWIESKTTTPVQVCKVSVPEQGQLNPLDGKLRAVAEKLNAEVQSALPNSVFKYYELIDSQWPLHPNAPAFAGGDQTAPESITHKTPGDVVPVFLVNSIMETFFQKGKQAAGPLEQDDRLAPGSPPIDKTEVIGTESCVGCHYSAGICIGFKKKDNGEPFLDAFGRRVPIYGENGHFGKTGHANFSWLFQIEAQAAPYSPPGVAKAEAPVSAWRSPAAFLKSGPSDVPVPPVPAPAAKPAAKH